MIEAMRSNGVVFTNHQWWLEMAPGPQRMIAPKTSYRTLDRIARETLIYSHRRRTIFGVDGLKMQMTDVSLACRMTRSRN
jgi:hypothetical protein